MNGLTLVSRFRAQCWLGLRLILCPGLDGSLWLVSEVNLVVL